MSRKFSVALYARVSSQQQAEQATIQSQVAAIRERIAHDGEELSEELCFLDEGYSGSTLLRPALERLRDVVYCGGIDRLYVHSPDRLARKYAWQMVLLDEFEKQDVEVIFLNHELGDQSPEGYLLLQMQGVIAEYERAKILERTRRGRRFAAREGKVSVLGHAPYGYRYISRHEGDGEARYEIVLEHAQHVRAMFTWVGVEGCSLRNVARRLTDQGVPTPRNGVRWTSATVQGLLRNTAYLGAARYGKTRLIPRSQRGRPARGNPAVPRREKVPCRTSCDEQEVIPVPALVRQELFDAVAARLEENRRRARERQVGANFLLSGLLVCQQCGFAYCGRRLSRKGSDVPYSYYRCLGTDKHRREPKCRNFAVHGGRLEAAVWADVCSLLQEPDRLRQEFERRLQHPPTEGLDLAREEEALTQLKRRVARLIDAYENGWLEKPDFETRMHRLKERMARDEATLVKRRQETLAEDQLQLLIGHFGEFAHEVATGLEDADFNTQRQLLRLLIDRIEVDEYEVRIVYKVSAKLFFSTPASTSVLQHCMKRSRTPGTSQNQNRPNRAQELRDGFSLDWPLPAVPLRRKILWRSESYPW